MKYLFSIIIIFFNIFCSFSQYQDILIRSNPYFPNEPCVCINPKNNLQIVVGTNDYYNGGFFGDVYAGCYYSTNAGINWSGGGLFSNIAKPSGDPVVFCDTLENFYFISITNYGLSNQWKGLILQRSTNGGANWNNGTYFSADTSKMHDKPWGCTDFSKSIYGNNIYITWTLFDVYGSPNPNDSTNIMFVRSTDHGNTFSQALRINHQAGNCRDSSLTVEGAVPCTGPNGEVYVAWAGPLGITFNKSIDAGNTWFSNEIVVSEIAGGWKGINLPYYNGFPIIGCDLSYGPNRGTIYINWVDQFSGLGDQDIWLKKSTNGGLSWSSRIRVNNDPPGKNQYFTWMSIDQTTGFLYFVFYDKRNYPVSSDQNDIYVARSTDGGNTFNNIKTNSSSFSSTTCHIGDYIGISAVNNRIRPVWIKCNGSVNQLYTANIDTFSSIGIEKVGFEVPQTFNLSQNYPNPFNPTTKIKFDIPHVKGEMLNVKLIIYDMLGREAATLVNEQLKPGTYETEWDGANFASGIYFYKLESGDFVNVKKMVLLK